MLPGVGGDGEGLLHQPVRLVAIAIWTTVGVALLVLRAVAGRVLVETAAATLALHFAVSKKAARHSTCAPRFAVRPSSHASFALIPDEDRARLDRLSFLLGKTALDTWKQTDATCLEQDDGVRGGADMAVVGLHAVHVDPSGGEASSR